MDEGNGFLLIRGDGRMESNRANSGHLDRAELSAESGLVVRRYTPADLAKINELWKKHHSHQFSLPQLEPSIITCVVEDDKGMIAFGNLKIFAETYMVMDHDRSKLERARAFKEIMPVAIMGAQRAGIHQIHACTQDPDFAERASETLRILGCSRRASHQRGRVMFTVTVLLILCALAALFMHAVKPATVPLWVAVLFIIVAILVSVLPIK